MGCTNFTFNDKNIVGLGSFKSYVGLWFYQGALLKDEANVLINAQENITKALRQWHFTSLETVNDKMILKYISEAIENQKQKKEIRPNRNKPLIIPVELTGAFQNNSQLENNFKNFAHGKQREFAKYISGAKRAETRQIRLQKIIPMIQQNVGLNDKYRK